MLNNILLIVALIGIMVSLLLQLRYQEYRGTHPNPDRNPERYPIASSNHEKMVSSALSALLGELETFGLRHDQACEERTERMLNITRDTGEFLGCMAIAMRARRILEIGTSNGYSTLWLANAARHTGGQVTTIEYAPDKIRLASDNFRKSGLAPYIRQSYGDAGPILNALDAKTFDLIFLDAERNEYLTWWPAIRSALTDGGLLIVDNAVSHAQELSDFIQQVQSDTGFCTALVPVGKGEFIATKLVTQAEYQDPST